MSTIGLLHRQNVLLIRRRFLLGLLPSLLSQIRIRRNPQKDRETRQTAQVIEMIHVFRFKINHDASFSSSAGVRSLLL